MAHPTSDPGDVLARGRFRSVFLVAGKEGGSDVVIKRFRHLHALKRLRDGVRARREYRLLEHLHASGVRVPRPLELVEALPAWDVHMQAVPQATSLELRLAERSPPARGWEPFLAQLGRELALVQAARVHLRDLGSKNVLVDGQGRPWLIDFHDARIRRRDFTPGEALADILAAAAAGREALSPRLRLRFLAAWLAASNNAPARPNLAALEARARDLRRALVAKGSDRWLRTSSRCSLRGAVLTRRGRGAEPVALTFESLPLKEARGRWRSAARLLEHGLPVARPGELDSRGATARVIFDAPSHWTTEDDLRALLRDRGLALASWKDALLVDGQRGVALRPPEQLLEL